MAKWYRLVVINWLAECISYTCNNYTGHMYLFKKQISLQGFPSHGTKERNQYVPKHAGRQTRACVTLIVSWQRQPLHSILLYMPGRHANSSHMFGSYLCMDTKFSNGTAYFNQDHGSISNTLPLLKNTSGGYTYHQVPSVRWRCSGVAVCVWKPLNYKSNLKI